MCEWGWGVKVWGSKFRLTNILILVLSNLWVIYYFTSRAAIAAKQLLLHCIMAKKTSCYLNIYVGVHISYTIVNDYSLFLHLCECDTLGDRRTYSVRLPNFQSFQTAFVRLNFKLGTHVLL